MLSSTEQPIEFDLAVWLSSTLADLITSLLYLIIVELEIQQLVLNHSQYSNMQMILLVCLTFQKYKMDECNYLFIRC